VSRPTRIFASNLSIRGCHPLRPGFPAGSDHSEPKHWPRPRSLATTDGVSLMSFPPGTEMFQFPGFAFILLFYSENKYLLLISVGPKTALFASRRKEPARRTQRLKACAASPSRCERASSEQQRSKVGFPIRRFTDQSLFAAPHDLSQRTTSFIASQRQGIHQIPLRHLIALIAKARFGKRRTDDREQKKRKPFCPLISVLRRLIRPGVKRPVLLQTHPGI
jgi:hypothetical protein